jgi:hypothetical protein
MTQDLIARPPRFNLQETVCLFGRARQRKIDSSNVRWRDPRLIAPLSDRLFRYLLRKD